MPLGKGSSSSKYASESKSTIAVGAHASDACVA